MYFIIYTLSYFMPFVDTNDSTTMVQINDKHFLIGPTPILNREMWILPDNLVLHNPFQILPITLKTKDLSTSTLSHQILNRDQTNQPVVKVLFGTSSLQLTATTLTNDPTCRQTFLSQPVPLFIINEKYWSLVPSFFLPVLILKH